MKIAVVASEAAPFVKTGGLGDVMQALPLALSRQKNTYVSLFVPYYSQIKYSGKWQTEFLGAFDVPLAWRREYVGIFRLKTRRKKLQIYFIDNEHYFNRGGIYGFADDGASVRDSIVMQGSKIGAGASVRYCILDKNVTIRPGTQLLGSKDHPLVVDKGDTV